MKKLRVLIVEDEVDNQELLQDFIATREELELVDIAGKADEAVRLLQKNKYDLMFLDIFLPDQTGFTVLEEFKNHPYVIFTTAYREHAIRAFEFGAIDYLVKPLELDRFHQSIDRALTYFKTHSNELPDISSMGLPVQEKESYYIVPFDKIIYLSAHNKYTVIHTTEKEIRTLKYLQEIEKRVPHTKFVRIHRQYIINVEFLSRIQHDNSGRYLAELSDSDDTTLPVSRTYADILKKLMGKGGN